MSVYHEAPTQHTPYRHQVVDTTRPGRCNDDGGVGIGAGHICRCTRELGHPMTDHSGRAHGCTCGALWGDR